MKDIKYYTVTFPRKKAIVTFDPCKKTVNAVHCTNSVFCNRFRLDLEDCPQFCEVIAEVKKFFRGRRPRALVCEIREDDLNREACSIKSLTPFQAETVSEL
ncbi:MAG: hypothetical protein ACLFO6_04540 [Archaeoglobaceae archaeon]